MTDLKYQRILLKLSGEALSPKEENGIDPQSIKLLNKSRSFRHGGRSGNCYRRREYLAWKNRNRSRDGST